MVGGVLCTWVILLGLAAAGPLSRFPRETEDYQNLDLSAYANFTANEVCFSDNEVFQKGDVMPNPGPCEECKCEPPSIVCQMVKCPVNNNGCRTIQRPNHCCPDYNCVCDYNGQLYNDGERLDLPDQPCQVCYCKGGEVMCTSLTCYIRDDCEPKHTPGQCCPKYENCPLRDMEATNTDDKNVRTRSPNKSNGSPKREMQPWLLTKSALQTSTAPKQPEEITTSGGNVIIVSDWLSERRTTPEDSEGRVTERTDRPDTTSPKYSRDKSVVVKNSDTITPLDEVIFTRIDMLKGRQNVELNSSTQDSTTFFNDVDLVTTLPPLPSSSVEEYTSTITGEFIETTTHSSDASQGDKLEIKNTSENCKGCSTYDYTQPTESSNIPDGTEDTKELVDNDSNHVKSLSNGSTDMPIKQVMNTPEPPLKYQNNAVENKTFDNSSSISNVTNIDVSHIADKAKLASENIWNSSDLSNYSNNDTNNVKTNGVSETKIALDVSNFNGTSTPVPTTLTTSQKGDPVLETSKTNKSTEQDEIKPMAKEELKDSLTLYSKSPEQILHDEDSSSPYVKNEEVDTTTPYFSEDFMIGPKQQSLKSLGEDSQSHEDSTDHELLTFPRNISTATVIGEFNNNNKEPNHEIIVEQVSDSGIGFTNTERPSIKPPSSDENIEKVNNKNHHSSEDSQSLPIKTENIHQADPHELYSTARITSNNRSIESNENNIPFIQKKSDDGDNIIFESEKKEESEESLEVMSNVPLVMDLNSHIPFLQIGGQTEFSTSTTIDEDDVETSTTNINTGTLKEVLETTLNPLDASLRGTLVASKQTNNPLEERKYLGENNQERVMEEVGETTTFENEAGMITTSNIPLTPADLKIIAEHIIKEKIKPVVSTQKLNYTSNQWLQGNLTSEDKIASIISAANVSINIMNNTDEKSRNLTSEKLPIKRLYKPRSDQFEKDTVYKGNVVTSTENSTVGSKIGYLNKKNISNDPKFNSKQMLNDGIETNIISTIEPNMSAKNTAKPETGSKQNFHKIRDAFLEINQSEHHVNEERFSGPMERLGEDVNETSTFPYFNSSTALKENNTLISPNIKSEPIMNSEVRIEKKINGVLARNSNASSQNPTLTSDSEILTSTQNTLDLSTINL